LVNKPQVRRRTIYKTHLEKETDDKEQRGADMGKRDSVNTGKLMEDLSTDPLADFLKKDISLPPFHDYIVQICLDRNETREHVIKRAGINRTYGHQLFNGTRKPSRDKVLQLSFGFGLDVLQTQKLLKVARQSQLVPQIKRDAAILYCIMHRFDIEEVQKLLLSFDMALLGEGSVSG